MASITSPEELSRNRSARRRIWIATGWYLGIIYVSQWVLWWLKGSHPAVLASIGLTPMIGLALMLRGVVLAHRESDELQRRIDGEAAVISACLVGLGTFAYGLAEAATGARTQPTVWALWVGPALMGFWGLAKTVITRRYR
jgi:hypothetical protein